MIVVYFCCGDLRVQVYRIAGNFRESLINTPGKITQFLFSPQGHDVWPHTLQFPAWKWWPQRVFQSVSVTVGENCHAKGRELTLTGCAARKNCARLVVSKKFLEAEIFTETNFRELVFDRAKIAKISRCTVWDCNTWCTPSQSFFFFLFFFYESLCRIAKDA